MSVMSSKYLARSTSERGEVVLRRRGDDGALELRVNGVFVMDTSETRSERMLAREALDAVEPSHDRLKVFLGGLGLGFTLSAVLEDERVASVVIAEIEPALVAWHRRGLVPGSRLGDARVCVETGDVRDVVAALEEGSVDVIALDVDNGPGFLVYDANAAVYRAPFLSSCRRALREHGLLTVWSADSAPTLTSALDEVFRCCVERRVPVELGRRRTSYHLYIARGSL